MVNSLTEPIAIALINPTTFVTYVIPMWLRMSNPQDVGLVKGRVDSVEI